MNWHMKSFPRHLPLMLFVDKLYLKLNNYMCANDYVGMYIILSVISSLCFCGHII